MHDQFKITLSNLSGIFFIENIIYIDHHQHNNDELLLKECFMG